MPCVWMVCTDLSKGETEVTKRKGSSPYRPSHELSGLHWAKRRFSLADNTDRGYESRT